MPQDIDDLPSIKHRISQLKSFTEKLQKLRDSVSEDDGTAFTKSEKLTTGQGCAHAFNEKYLGLLKSLDTEIKDHLKTMQNTEAKNTRMYPLVNTCTALKKIRQKGNKNKAKRRRSELEEKKCGRYFNLLCLRGDQS